MDQSSSAIHVEQLGKRYVIDHQVRHDTLRDALSHGARGLWRALRLRRAENRAAYEDFWALQDVSFTVNRGEVIGVIGRNGAGKSTLLKILSRITEPTTGRIQLRGRVASLLEVGTGFHPELTGRENIFLNGSILGMTRAEIRSKFDAIVAFAEVEKFLDTPVKRYSSGMYVRLAFAVAAHLEPEILIVDEVLAVGDAQFQQKCIGKIQAVAAGEGRTILFVSHNLDTVQRLCGRSLWLDQGRLRLDSSTERVLSRYQAQGRAQEAIIDLSSRPANGQLRGHAQFCALAAETETAAGTWSFPFGSPLAFRCTVRVRQSVSSLSVAYAVFSVSGFEIASAAIRPVNRDAVEPGDYDVALRLPHLRLAPGRYTLNFGLQSAHGAEDFVAEAAAFEVTNSQLSAQEGVDLIRAACVPSTTVTLQRR